MALLNQFLRNKLATQDVNTTAAVNVSGTDRVRIEIIANLHRVFQCRRTVESVLGIGLQDYCAYTDHESLMPKLCEDLTVQIARCESRLTQIEVNLIDSGQCDCWHFEVSAYLDGKSISFLLQLKKP